MPMMRLGSFVFSIPTFSFESLNQKVSARAESQQVIGAAPPTHLLGPNGDTINLTASFYPFHLNRGGLAQVRSMNQAVRSQAPLMMVGINGLVYGRWIITDISNQMESFHPNGSPQKVDVDISLIQYVGNRGSLGFAIGLF